MARVLFLVVSAVTIISALGVVSLPNVFHAALALVLSLLGVALLYALLGAGYVAAVQVLVYVGAISVLIILAIMVSERIMGRGEEARESAFNQQRWLTGAIAAALFAVITAGVVSVGWPVITQPVPVDMVGQLGMALMGKYALPFEVASVVLLASLMGAVYIIRDS